MANVKDAEVLFIGIALDLVPITSRENPGVIEGYKLTAMVPGGGGFATVKITNLDLASNPGLIDDIKPGQTQIAWFIRNAAYSIDANSGMSTRFVRVATAQDVMGLGSMLGLSSASAKSNSPEKVAA